jgi:hypothetical protein
MSAVQQPAGLVAVLLDPGAAVTDRDDAAMDLAGYDEPEALAALLQVGRDANAPEIILASVGESIAEILLRGRQTRRPEVDELAPAARREFDARVGATQG